MKFTASFLVLASLALLFLAMLPLTSYLHAANAAADSPASQNKIARVLGSDLQAFIDDSGSISVKDKKRNQSILQGQVFDKKVLENGNLLIKCLFVSGEKLELVSGNEKAQQTQVVLKDGCSLSGKITDCNKDKVTVVSSDNHMYEFKLEDLSWIKCSTFCTLAAYKETEKSPITPTALITGYGGFFSSNTLLEPFWTFWNRSSPEGVPDPITVPFTYTCEIAPCQRMDAWIPCYDDYVPKTKEGDSKNTTAKESAGNDKVNDQKGVNNKSDEISLKTNNGAFSIKLCLDPELNFVLEGQRVKESPNTHANEAQVNKDPRVQLLWSTIEQANAYTISSGDTTVTSAKSPPNSSAAVLCDMRLPRFEKTPCPRLQLRKPENIEAAQTQGCKIRLYSQSNPLECKLLVENSGKNSMELVLPAYTCFLSPNPTTNQNMIKGSDPVFLVPAHGSTSLTIDTFCASTKSIKTPPAEGLDYRIGSYPEPETFKFLQKIVETAMRMEKESIFDKVPVDPKMRARRIAQTAIWLHLGKKSGKTEDLIDTKHLKADLLDSLETKKLSEDQENKIEQFASKIYEAAKQTLSAAGEQGY